MGKMTWTVLQNLLAERYDDFRLRLTRRLGSAELACESLHETWLRFDRGSNAAFDLAPVGNPVAYVMRTALNVAIDRLRSESWMANRSLAITELEIADSAPDPVRQIEGRRQVAVLKEAVNALPKRAQEILLAARVQGLSQQQIADHFGVSTRTVRTELRRALDFCESRMKTEGEGAFLSQPDRSSIGRSSLEDTEATRGDNMGRELKADDQSHG